MCMQAQFSIFKPRIICGHITQGLLPLCVEQKSETKWSKSGSLCFLCKGINSTFYNSAGCTHIIQERPMNWGPLCSKSASVYKTIQKRAFFAMLCYIFGGGWIYASISCAIVGWWFLEAAKHKSN